MHSADTIAAVASAPGAAGIGIIRISGPAAATIARTLLGREPRPRYAHHARFTEPDGALLDQGLLLWFPAPRSYTGEDVLELHAHGSPVLLDLLLRRVYALGARPARPGEFTERAFLNGKLDLAQAEAVADIIAAGSEAALRAAQRSLAGAFSERVRQLQEGLTAARVQIEATLDFPDEELEILRDPALIRLLDELNDMNQGVLAAAHRGLRLARGLEVVLVGAPNVGKSSLLNALVGVERAIVTPVPGTTRDVLHVDVAFDGIRLQIADTAGLRESDDVVEQEGIRRARAELARVDLALLVTRNATWSQDLAWLRAHFQPLPPILLVLNKIDLDGVQPQLLGNLDGLEGVALSARSGAGIDLLQVALRERAGAGDGAEGAFSARERHVRALQQTAMSIEAARDEVIRVGSGGMAELAADALRLAQSALDDVTGVHSSDDLLGAIFSSFCIGK